jgi:hypothetical protein
VQQAFIDEHVAREAARAALAGPTPLSKNAYKLPLLHRSPDDAMRRFLLPRIAGLRGKSMVERLAINILGMGRQVMAHRRRQIVV